jgi:SAM-dependent methyltransferase
MKDYFGNQSALYAARRPQYPQAFFDFISNLCEVHRLAWDCGTGNGQTARSLADYFENVIATDVSAKQLSNSFKKDNIYYSQEPAEQSSLKDLSADLITVSTAIHWFDIPKFYNEVERVLKPGGLLGIWSYAGCRINTEIDVLINHYSFTLLRDYWPVQTRLNWLDQYASLSFPYKQLPIPDFEATADYNLHDFEMYLDTWSAVQEYILQNNTHPFKIISDELHQLWGNPSEIRKITWPLFIKAGYKS